MSERRWFQAVCCLAYLLIVLFLVGGLGCSSSPTVQDRSDTDEEFERTSRAARMAFDTGKLQQAVDLYNQALDRAYVLDDLNAIVDSKYNLAVCLTRLGSYGQALEQVNQAKAELDRTNRSIPADILLLEATIVYRMDELDNAWQLTEMILLDASRLSEAVQSKTHFLRGLIAVERGDIHQLRHEITALGKPSAVGLRADREELLGRLAVAEGNWREAMGAFDNTVAFRRDDFDYREMANALALAAWACEQAGKLSEASKRYLRAGRSAAQQGGNHNATNWLTRAEKLAAEAGDETTAKQARTYRKWLETP
jgi:tetratricopeptide (TPR) repeat protein